jgi:kynurenine formamidase
MRFRGFIISFALVPFALVLAVLLFAERRPAPPSQNSYSQVVDLTDPVLVKAGGKAISGTRVISPAALIPGTWGAAQIPAERLIAPLVVMDLHASSAEISLDDIANWEAQHENVPQGAIVAVRRAGSAHTSSSDQFPVSADAAQFLMEARCTRGFIVETPISFGHNRTLSRQIALRGDYVVEGSARLTAIPETGSLIIVAPEKNGNVEGPVRVLALIPRTPN